MGRWIPSWAQLSDLARLSPVRISVLGAGYLGTTHAACMADLGHDVVAVDLNAERIATLAAGTLPFYEPGLDEVLGRALASGRLRFTTDIAEAAAFADVHFVCVGTPQREGSFAADMSQIWDSVESLLAHIDRPCLIVGKSTVPVGTAAAILQRLEGTPARLAWNPEFLQEGRAVADTVRPDRLVIATTSREDSKILREIYASLIDAKVPVIETDFATAELVKVSANAFLATKISFINAMAEVCEASGADVSALAEALGHDPRIGSLFLRAGLGFGGGCLPKDIRAFMARADELGVDQAVSFLRDVEDINLRRRGRTVDLTREVLGGELAGARIGIWGAAFKPDSDDVRDSPALNVAQMLHDAGAIVKVHDPKAIANARAKWPQLDYAQTAMDAAQDCDVLLHLTEWREYRALHPLDVRKVVRKPQLIDARNALDPHSWREAGWTYRALGRPNA